MSEGVDRAAGERAAYVHIPFCHRRCPYCDFAVVDLSQQESSFERYVSAVVAEIEMAEPWQPLHAVNFGGGTPSILSAEQLRRILGALERRFGLEADAEISIEANPEDVDTTYAGGLRDAAINRVSLGVQSFDPGVLDALGRGHTPDDAVAAVAAARDVGMRTVNVDLIFGTPGESVDSWSHSVEQALELDVEHLSAYALTVELGTALSKKVSGGEPAPDSDDQADKYELLCETVGLHHYEISNWADPGHECRYNLTTWTQGEYDAFGNGAHSYRDGVRHRNFRRLDAYLEHVEAGRRPVQGSERLDEWGREKERLFLGLRLRSGVKLGTAGEALLATEAGGRFVAAGVISFDRDRLYVDRPLLADAVAREVLGLDGPLF